MGDGKTAKIWSKTKVQGLLRRRGGGYYSRFFVSGKEKWVSHGTEVLEVAKAKHDKEKEAIQGARGRGWEPATGRILMAAVIERYKADLATRVGIKDSTKGSYIWKLKALLKSWPTLPEMEAGQVTEVQCKEWAFKYASNSSSYYNGTVLVLKEIFAQSIAMGTRYSNPAERLESKPVRPKPLTLPSREQFHQLVAELRSGRHRTSKDAADLVEFLTYSGTRISEARRVTWTDCDFERGVILVKGAPETGGPKNGRFRTIPMISEMKDLLERIQKARPPANGTSDVLKLKNVRGALKRGTTKLGIAHLSHHDFRHLFASTCIESAVDIPTTSRWLGHLDGGSLAMRTYGHLRDEHSIAAAQKVSFASKAQKRQNNATEM